MTVLGMCDIIQMAIKMTAILDFTKYLTFSEKN